MQMQAIVMQFTMHKFDACKMELLWQMTVAAIGIYRDLSMLYAVNVYSPSLFISISDIVSGVQAATLYLESMKTCSTSLSHSSHEPIANPNKAQKAKSNK